MQLPMLKYDRYDSNNLKPLFCQYTWSPICFPGNLSYNDMGGKRYSSSVLCLFSLLSWRLWYSTWFVCLGLSYRVELLCHSSPQSQSLCHCFHKTPKEHEPVYRFKEFITNFFYFLKVLKSEFYSHYAK